MRWWLGVCHWVTETLISAAAHTHTAYTMGVVPPGFEVLVWQDFIRVVVLRLLTVVQISRATNTSEIIHKTDF